MSQLCKAFFANLTSTLVAKTDDTKQADSDILKLKSLEISSKAASIATEEYLQDDTYVLHLDKLIAPGYQEKLRETFGEDWLTVVNSMYINIEREVHAEMVSKLSGINYSDGG